MLKPTATRPAPPPYADGIMPAAGRHLVCCRMPASVTAVMLLLLSLCSPSWLYAFDIDIKNDQMTIHAINVPLQDVLKRLAGFGIAVRIDPDINPQVSASFESRDLEDGLRAILKPQNHVFFWKQSIRKDGETRVAAYQLDEIQVFKPGLEGRMINFEPSDRAAQKIPPKVFSLPDTEVQIENNRVLVPVTIGYRDETVETTLIFDTGAGSIVLHDNIAEQLGIRDARESRGVGVGGVEVESRTTHLKFVQVGPHRKENLRADIIAYKGEPGARYNGLLGMNFIRGLKYTIDFNNQVIQWHP